MYEQVLYEVSDPIATIKLNRPDKLNAWTMQMAAEMKHAVAQAEADPAVVAIVLTGEGRGFCSGADMKGLQDLSGGVRGGAGEGSSAELEADPGDPDVDPSFRAQCSYLMSVRKPVIAAINGPCAGMAMPIALCCDLRFASDRARFTTAFSRRGLIAEWGISWTLARLVGHANAIDLILSARTFDAREAERIGLVNRVLAHDELLPFVCEYAKDLAEHCSPTSMAIMKKQIYADTMGTLDQANKESFRLMVESFSRPDFKEGVSSFMERRPPRFERI